METSLLAEDAPDCDLAAARREHLEFVRRSDDYGAVLRRLESELEAAERWERRAREPPLLRR